MGDERVKSDLRKKQAADSCKQRTLDAGLGGRQCAQHGAERGQRGSIHA